MAVRTAVGERAQRAETAAVRPRTSVRLAAYALLTAALAGYLGLAWLYRAAVPAWEAPDETGHFAYVRHLLVERSLPTRTIGGNNEFHQPPLAYLLYALAAGDLETGAFERIKPNPAFIWTRAGDQPNVVLHTRDETPPRAPLYEALSRLRALSVLLGAGCVLAAFALGRTIFPQRPMLAAGAAAFVAGLPQFIFATSVVNNDALTFLLCSLAAVSLARILTGRDASPGEHLRLGALLGLGLLAKVNVFALVGVALLALAWRAWRSAPRRPALRGLVATGAAAALVGGPWYLRNYLLYRGWFANQTYVDDQTLPQIAAFGFGPATIWEAFARPLLESSFAQFGWMTLKADPAYYLAFDGLLLLSLLGLVLWFLRGRAPPSQRRAVVACALLFGALVALTAARWVTTIGNHYPQGRYLFPAIAPLGLLVALGLDSLLARRAAGLLALLLGGSLFAASYHLVGAYADPQYQPLDLWLDPPARIERPTGQVLGDQLHLLGWEVDRASLAPGETATVRLYWQALARPESDYHVFLHLALPTDEPLAQHDTVPGAPAYPIGRWLPGDVVLDPHTLQAPADAPPGRYRLLVGAYRFPNMRRLPATAPADGRDVLEIGALTITAR